MAPPTSPLTLGRYGVFDRIASGGMATVYFGQLVGSGGFSRIVALKRLHPHLSEEPEFTKMLLDEAYLAGRIRHPNVVSTLDTISDAGELVIVMDYVHGESLSRLGKSAQAREERVPLKVAVAIMVGVLNGLHAAHETQNELGAPLGIVHRDVSPQNVIVGVDGVARVLDFGIAKAHERLQTTRTGEVKGKIGYMAVEQLTSEPVDRRADIYAAGVVFWELLTGRRLFRGENDSTTLQLVLGGRAAAPSSIQPDVPPELDAVTRRALSRSKADRYDTARQMAAAIESAVAAASTNEVGEWVTATAAEVLEARSKILQSIEARGAHRRDGGVPRAHDPRREESSLRDTQPETAMAALEPPSGADGPEPGDPESNLASRPSRARRGLIAVGACFLVLAVSAGVWTGERRSTSSLAASPSSAVLPAPPPSVATVIPPEPAPPVVPATPSTGSVAASLPSPPLRSARPASPANPAPASRKSAAAARCNPPWSIDESGVKRYKSGCSLD